MRYDPPGTAESNPTEHAIAQAINDHANKMRIMVTAIGALQVKLESHEIKINMQGPTTRNSRVSCKRWRRSLSTTTTT